VEWQRPHPLTLVTLVVQALSQTILPLIIVLGGSDEEGSFFGQYAEVLFFLVPLGLAFARWYSTRYALDDEAVYLNSGIFKRTKQVLRRSKIQNLSTTAPLLARATGLVELNISDASADGDIRLRLIERAEAERLTALLRSDLSQPIAAPLDAPPPEKSSGGPDPDPSPIFAPPVVQSAGHQYDSPPAVNPPTAKLIRMSAALSANGGLPIVLLGLWLSWLNWVNGDPLAELLPFQMPVWGWPIVVPLVVLFVGVVATAGRVLTLGGFRLWDDPDRLRMKAGLLTERQITARRERIQLIRVNRPWLAQRLGLEEVRFSTADVEDPQTAGMTILNPAADIGDWIELAPRAIGTVELSEDQLQRVSPLARRRVFLRFLFLALIVALCSVGAGLIWSRLIIVTGPASALVLVAFGWFFAKRRFERLGYAIGPTQVLTRVGVLNEKLTLLRKEKVQGVLVSSSFFQRRLNLATLSVGTAGHGGSLGGLRLPDLPNSVATELAFVLAKDAAATPLERTL
jgi:putative membrane protein